MRRHQVMKPHVMKSVIPFSMRRHQARSFGRARGRTRGHICRYRGRHSGSGRGGGGGGGGGVGGGFAEYGRREAECEWSHSLSNECAHLVRRVISHVPAVEGEHEAAHGDALCHRRRPLEHLRHERASCAGRRVGHGAQPEPKWSEAEDELPRRVGHVFILGLVRRRRLGRRLDATDCGGGSRAGRR